MSVKISPKYQIVIPRIIRESMKLRPGQEVEVVEYDGRIEVVPIRSIDSIRGILKNPKNEFIRDEEDRFWIY